MDLERHRERPHQHVRPDNLGAKAVSYHRVDHAIDALGRFPGRLTRRKGGWVEFNHYWDGEAGRGNVKADRHLAYCSHLHPAHEHRRPRLEATDGFSEAYEEWHAVCDAGLLAIFWRCLGQPERLLPQLQQIARTLRQLDRCRGAGLCRPGKPEDGKQHGNCWSDRHPWRRSARDAGVAIVHHRRNSQPGQVPDYSRPRYRRLLSCR